MKRFLMKYAYLYTSILIILSLSLICVANMGIFIDKVNNILNTVGKALIISGVVGLITQIFVRVSMTEFVLEKVQLKNDILNSGIVEIYANAKDVDYTELFKNTYDEINIVCLYAKSWSHGNVDLIRDFIQKRNGIIKVFLISPDSKFTEALDNFFDSSTKLKTNIQEVIEFYTKLYEEIENPKGKIELYLYKSRPVATIFRFDNNMIIINNIFSNTKTKYLPVLKIKKGKHDKNLFLLYEEEIKELEKESQKLI